MDYHDVYNCHDVTGLSAGNAPDVLAIGVIGQQAGTLYCRKLIHIACNNVRALFEVKSQGFPMRLLS